MYTIKKEERGKRNLPRLFLSTLSLARVRFIFVLLSSRRAYLIVSFQNSLKDLFFIVCITTKTGQQQKDSPNKTKTISEHSRGECKLNKDGNVVGKKDSRPNECTQAQNPETKQLNSLKNHYFNSRTF